ncbi:MAG TPA: LysM peptidoglycan-binding domain-containing protein, partial [Tenericutes bacterium]|nr:LysM peptidoglycan-binding domain-containing protein [Mycoplasmatota bacterium]
MNYKIVIDAGHGGDDPGASGNGIIEKNLNLEISKHMYNEFVKRGITPKMTRTTDETLSPNERVKRVLNAFGNGKDVIVISNHINAGGGDGAEVIYALRNKSTLSNLILENLEKKGQNIRKAYQRRLPSDTSKDYYFMQRETPNTEAITVEYGFLDSTGDDVTQLKNNYKQYAEAVVDAVIEYLTESNIYVVQKGDSLWSIAKKFNTTVNDIKDLNNLTTNSLSVGQKIRIPSAAIIEKGTYVVKSGDSLYSIAQRYGITVDELKRANNLTSNILSVGQTLKIPTTENIIEKGTYVVKSGDSLYSIAQKYGITVDELKRANNLTSNTLSIGQTLIIPTAETPPISDYINYTVVSGDSLYSIAKKYNTTVDELIGFNSLQNTLLNPGQILKIPVPGTTVDEPQQNYINYTVKSGDNLYAIARNYNTSVDSIITANNLKNT